MGLRPVGQNPEEATFWLDCVLFWSTMQQKVARELSSCPSAVHTHQKPSTRLPASAQEAGGVCFFRPRQAAAMVSAVPDRPAVQAATLVEKSEETRQRPDSQGRFGRYGGKYVPETLVAALSELEIEFKKAIRDPDFQVSVVVLPW